MELYRNHEKKKVKALIETGWFNGDPGNGNFDGHNYPFVFKNNANNFINLYKIQQEIISMKTILHGGRGQNLLVMPYRLKFLV